MVAAPLALYRTTIGKKVVMAVSGLILVGFVVAHMLGNLKIYLGADAINTYAGFLRDVGEPLVPRAENSLFAAAAPSIGTVQIAPPLLNATVWLFGERTGPFPSASAFGSPPVNGTLHICIFGSIGS